MDENIKNLREAQQQSGSQQSDNNQSDETDSVDVQVVAKEAQKESSSAQTAQRQDALRDVLTDQMSDPMSGEELSDVVVEDLGNKKKTPLRKLMVISKSLNLRMAKEAFVEDDPAAFTDLLREVRALATKDFTEAEVDMLHSFRTELDLLRKRAKKSVSQTELTPFEINKVDTIIEKIINLQEVLLESDAPFVIEDTSGLEDTDDGLANIEDLDESIIDPTDQEQLLDDEIYLVEIEEEEADDYTRWTEPILQLIAVRDPKKLK